MGSQGTHGGSLVERVSAGRSRLPAKSESEVSSKGILSDSENSRDSSCVVAEMDPQERSERDGGDDVRWQSEPPDESRVRNGAAVDTRQLSAPPPQTSGQLSVELLRGSAESGSELSPAPTPLPESRQLSEPPTERREQGEVSVHNRGQSEPPLTAERTPSLEVSREMSGPAAEVSTSLEDTSQQTDEVSKSVEELGEMSEPTAVEGQQTTVVNQTIVVNKSQESGEMPSEVDRCGGEVEFGAVCEPAVVTSGSSDEDQPSDGSSSEQGKEETTELRKDSEGQLRHENEREAGQDLVEPEKYTSLQNPTSQFIILSNEEVCHCIDHHSVCA